MLLHQKQSSDADLHQLSTYIQTASIKCHNLCDQGRGTFVLRRQDYANAALGKTVRILVLKSLKLWKMKQTSVPLVLLTFLIKVSLSVRLWEIFEYTGRSMTCHSLVWRCFLGWSLRIWYPTTQCPQWTRTYFSNKKKIQKCCSVWKRIEI